MVQWISMLLGLSAPFALLAAGGEGGGAAAEPAEGAEAPAPGEPEGGGGAGEAAAPADAPAAKQTMDEFIAEQHPALAKARGIEAPGEKNALEGTGEPADAAQQTAQLADLKKKVGPELAKFVTAEDVGETVGRARRIAMMRQRQGNAEREAQALREENARLKGVAEGKGVKLEPADPGAAKPAADDADPRPKAEDFSDPAAFDEADRRWVVRDERRKERATEQQTQTRTQQTQAREAFTKASNAVAVRVSELHDDAPENFNLTQTLTLGIVRIAKTEPDLAAEIAYFLATDPEGERIRTLDDYEQALELGALRKSLAKPAAGTNDAAPKPGAATAGAAPAPRQTAATTAPPLRRVQPSGGAPPTPYTAKTMEDYRKSRLAELRK